MKRVTAALLIKNDRILIAQRGMDDKLAGKWEFPGGKIEEGETPEECLAREMKEEFQIEISIGDFFGSSTHSYDQSSIELLAYWATWKTGSLKLTVHAEYRWASLEELQDFDFAPADIPFVHKLQEVGLLPQP